MMLGAGAHSSPSRTTKSDATCIFYVTPVLLHLLTFS